MRLGMPRVKDTPGIWAFACHAWRVPKADGSGMPLSKVTSTEKRASSSSLACSSGPLRPRAREAMASAVKHSSGRRAAPTHPG